MGSNGYMVPYVSLTVVVETVSLLKVEDVKCVGGCGPHVGNTEVVPLDIFLGVEVRVQD